MPLNNDEFCENMCSESCISLLGVNDILAVISTLFIRFEINSAEEIIIIIIIRNLSNDRSKAASKTIPPHSAI